MDSEKDFDRVPQEVVWWGMHNLDADEWLVRVVQYMYCNVQSRVGVNVDLVMSLR